MENQEGGSITLCLYNSSRPLISTAWKGIIVDYFLNNALYTLYINFFKATLCNSFSLFLAKNT